MTQQTQWPFRWDLLLRYRLIEIITLWEGRLTTKALIQAFGIGRQQASKDINNYIKEVAPNNLTYDKKLKGYKPTSQFSPVLTRGEISEYLQLLNSRQDLLNQFESLNINQANTQVLSPPARAIEPEVISPIILAARENKRVDIRYVSLSSPQAKERIIAPHTIVFNGQRWHIRAYCEEQQGFRDFVLSRIVEVYDLEGTSNNTIEQDVAWSTQVAVSISPDPRLNPHQQSIIARDYSMKDNQRDFQLRGALVTYFLQLLKLDYQTPHENPLIQQIVVNNMEELAQWRF
ncbi:helix-turn-helix transcriptional regulator [Aliikangiella coralliicola]|uniref:WYL domain-containing protein n=1 Tax=Aliikangiella coralliicola TaxID=2592383 RepID=A0A545TW94_9GAMM|nr:WYL domain-containing protein [Aliikangiella coralliicola]TQV81493.1 WYL domain-containing protein [Aliikangiella coralliicola]